MQQTKQLTIIVPNKAGIAALANLPAVNALLVEPGKSIQDDAAGAEVLVVGPAEQQSEVDDALRQINQLPQLKLLQTLGQGSEQWDGLLPEGVTISTARGAHGASVAEWVLAVLLNLVRDLPYYAQNQQAHSWHGRRARTLQNMHLMIFGLGDLGSNIQSRLLPFGARLTMVGSHQRDGVVDMATAQTLLTTVDAVIMALPLTKQTVHTVDGNFLAALPKGTIVINAGRGGLVDQPALLKELRSGRLQAALDVMTPEPLPADDPLWEAPGLLLTPHIAGNTDGADDRAWHVAALQIKAYIEGNLDQ